MLLSLSRIFWILKSYACILLLSLAWNRQMKTKIIPSYRETYLRQRKLHCTYIVLHRRDREERTSLDQLRESLFLSISRRWRRMETGSYTGMSWRETLPSHGDGRVDSRRWLPFWNARTSAGSSRSASNDSGNEPRRSAFTFTALAYAHF